jgi:4-aminobutyrate aminotransferase-like enzyme
VNNRNAQARNVQVTARGVGVLCDFFVARAENAELWDIEGRRFIDFASGIAVNNVGHRHPKVVQAVRGQLDRFIHTAYQVVPYVSDAAQPGGLGGTYAGNPLGIAAAHAVLEIIEEEQLADRANMLGRQLRERFERMRARAPELGEVRGLGSMIAADFVHPGAATPNPEFARAIQERALERGLLLLTCGQHGSTIRFLFPLTIPQPVFDEALEILEQTIMVQSRATSCEPAR